DERPDLTLVVLPADDGEFAVQIDGTGLFVAGSITTRPALFGVIVTAGPDLHADLDRGLVWDQIAAGLFVGIRKIHPVGGHGSCSLCCVGLRDFGDQRVTPLAAFDLGKQLAKVRFLDLFEATAAVLRRILPRVWRGADEATELRSIFGLQFLIGDDLIHDARQFSSDLRAVDLRDPARAAVVVLFLIEDA